MKNIIRLTLIMSAIITLKTVANDEFFMIENQANSLKIAHVLLQRETALNPDLDGWFNDFENAITAIDHLLFIGFNEIDFKNPNLFREKTDLIINEENRTFFRNQIRILAIAFPLATNELIVN